MKLPTVNLQKLREKKERNKKERLLFVKWYAEWVKRTRNSAWSAQQKSLQK